jgi:hypothetical protein
MKWQSPLIRSILTRCNQTEWHKWFAWYPVVTIEQHTVLGETIYRRKNISYFGRSEWEYRENLKEE